MKKYLTVAIILFVSACATSPESNKRVESPKPRSTETVPRLGIVSGMTEYVGKENASFDQLSTKRETILFLSDTESKMISTVLYDGEVTNPNTGLTDKFDNVLVRKDIRITSLKKTPAGLYTFVNNSNIPVALKTYTYVFTETIKKSESWESSHSGIGGTDQWKTQSSVVGYEDFFLVKEENGKLYRLDLAKGSSANEFVIHDVDNPTIYIKQ